MHLDGKVGRSVRNADFIESRYCVFQRLSDLKCEFDENNPDLPCKRCVAKRYVCTAKLLGPKSQVVLERAVILTRPSSVSRTIVDQLLPPNDLLYLQYYGYIFRCKRICSPRRSITFTAGMCRIPFYDLGFDINSKLFRGATLALASFVRHRLNRLDTYLSLKIY